MDPVCRRPPRKMTLNGYALYRQQVVSEIRQSGRSFDSTEVDRLTSERWEVHANFQTDLLS